MMKVIFGVVVFVALAAAFTKPTPQHVEAILKEQTLQAVHNTEVDLTDMGVDGAMVTLCKLQPNGCWDVLRQLTEITHEDRYVYARVGIDGPGEPRVCNGLFRQLL